ncbi:MAG: TonB-dependent receptor [Chloroherpetonaceae bacterium]|nr:TonB-dependent receptor [Chloroherpetonaceae bacterium]
MKSLISAFLALVCLASFSAKESIGAAIEKPATVLGTTGKLTGSVIDVNTKEPLIGANIKIDGTRYGGTTDANGNYTILNIPPGTYTIKASYLGYQPKTVTNIRIKADYTERLDFVLNTDEIRSDEIVIRAERPIVVKDQTYSAAVVSSEEIQALPVEDINQVIGIQAGVVGGSFRGGRRNEVAYLVDGISVTDVFDGNFSRTFQAGASNFIDPQTIQEVQVISGAFNAEYGQAMSGIVNIITKDGSEKYTGQMMLYGGDYLTSRASSYRGLSSVSPLAIPNMQANISGPVPFTGNDLTFYAAGRYFANDGFLNGIRQYQPGDVLSLLDVVNNPYALLQTPFPAIRGRFVIGNQGFGTISFPGNPTSPPIALDQNGRAIVDRANGIPVAVPYNPTTSNLAIFNNYRNLGTGDDAVVPLSNYERRSFQTKLAFKGSAILKLTYSLNYEDENFRSYDHGWSLNPDGDQRFFRNTLNHIGKITYTASNTTFIEATYSNYNTRSFNYVFENPLDPRYQFPGLGGNVGQGDFFLAGGTKNDRFDRTTNTNHFRADLTSQMTDIHLVKMGVDVKFHRLDFNALVVRDQFENGVPNLVNGFQPELADPVTELGGGDVYQRTPFELAAYLQDKIEFGSLVINLGIRFDYFNSRTTIPRDPSDPSEFIKLLPDSIYAERNGTTNRQIDATPKYAISPRLGVSFPITENGLVYFSFGQFFQMPQLSLLYENSRYKYGEQAGAGGFIGPFGNPDIKPQRTTSGEIGLQQQIGESIGINLTAYFRDIRDLASSAFIRDLVNGAQYFIFDNFDYGFVRGITLSVTQQVSNAISFGVDYTLQIAQGNSADPGSAANQRRGGAEVETQLLPLPWDQRHTLNITANYASDDWNVGVIARYGSGFPFTPELIPAPSGGVARLITNTATSPATFTMDLRASKNFNFDGVGIGLFLQVFNLLDAANELGVYARTGSAVNNILLPIQNNQFNTLNTVEEFFQQPGRLSEPRRLSLGMTLNF